MVHPLNRIVHKKTKQTMKMLSAQWIDEMKDWIGSQ